MAQHLVVLRGPSTVTQSLTPQWSAIGLKPASGSAVNRRLGSGIGRLDDFLEGGLPLGSVSEWGAPLGHGGRDSLLAWLARATQGQAVELGNGPAWVLWAHARRNLVVYPPAWMARGVRLERMRFACTPAPLADLRPVFLEPFFRLLILDAPRQFSEEDCAFVARQARAQGQTVVVVRDTLLGSHQGNVWARLRLNAWYDDETRQHRLQVVRGLSPRQLALTEDEIGVHRFRAGDVGVAGRAQA
jgi:hypothetical protein